MTAFLFLELLKSIKPLFLHQDCAKSRLIKSQDYSKILLVRHKDERERDSTREREGGKEGVEKGIQSIWCSIQYVICLQHCIQDPIHLF